MNDLAKYVAHMAAAARAGLTPAQCMQRDLEQREAFEAWRREVDAVGESAEMDGLGRVPRWPGNGAPDSTVAVGSQCTPDHPSLQSDDDFNFTPACRELAAHFMPGADAIGINYLAQALMDCAQEYLAAGKEMKANARGESMLRYYGLIGDCHAGQDGECNWAECPQLRDGEPEKNHRHCPLDNRED